MCCARCGCIQSVYLTHRMSESLELLTTHKRSGHLCIGFSALTHHSIVCTLANSYISKLLPSRQKAWNQKVQERVALTSKMLSNMKTVKMMGFSPYIETVLQTARMTELAASAGFRRFMAIVNTIGMCSSSQLLDCPTRY